MHIVYWTMHSSYSYTVKHFQKAVEYWTMYIGGQYWAHFEEAHRSGAHYNLVMHSELAGADLPQLTHL